MWFRSVLLCLKERENLFLDYTVPAADSEMWVFCFVVFLFFSIPEVRMQFLIVSHKIRDN